MNAHPSPVRMRTFNVLSFFNFSSKAQSSFSTLLLKQFSDFGSLNFIVPILLSCSYIILFMGDKHLDIHVYGRVQGVFFRDNTRNIAQQLGLVGFVKNEDSGGGVYIEAEGPQEQLDEFLKWCKKGPAEEHQTR